MTFWDAYPNFRPNARATIQSEFNRLASQEGWKKGSNRYRAAYARCMGQEFTDQFGSDGKLEGYQELCREIGISPAPGSVTQCKQVRGSSN
jgi:hypothetical protein